MKFYFHVIELLSERDIKDNIKQIPSILTLGVKTYGGKNELN